MAKKTYLLQGRGFSETVQAGSIKAAISKGPGALAEVTSAIEVRKSAERLVKIGTDGSYTVSFPEGYFVASSLESLNEMLAKLGYKALRETSNMLNKKFGTFLIDADTPSYCDPGSEAYHSM